MRRMMHAARPLLTACVLLAACAQDPLQWSGQWSRPATPGQTLAADLDSCRSEANEATERAQQLDRDVAFGEATARTDNIGPLLGEMRRFDTTKLYYGGVERCMRDRGYVPIGLAR